MNFKLAIFTIFTLIARALCEVDCSSFSSCQECSAQVQTCGWCASDADGGGSCIHMTDSWKPVTPCPSGYWNLPCCSGHDSCDDCSNYNGCKWCESGSSVNGNKCIPYDYTWEPQLGGCDLDYYTNSCCGDYNTCDECSNANNNNHRCKWCQKGSSINGGRCLPYNSSWEPMWGGCDADYYTNACCQDMQTCTDCVSKGWNCKWCGEASTVNPNECLPYDSSWKPMYGGCDPGNFTNTCPANFISF